MDCKCNYFIMILYSRNFTPLPQTHSCAPSAGLRQQLCSSVGKWSEFNGQQLDVLRTMAQGQEIPSNGHILHTVPYDPYCCAGVVGSHGVAASPHSSHTTINKSAQKYMPDPLLTPEALHGCLPLFYGPNGLHLPASYTAGTNSPGSTALAS